MSRKSSFRILTTTTCLFLIIREVYGAPVSDTKTILETIKSDPNICPTRDIFIESRYAKSCNEIKYPHNLTALDSNNTDVYLCLGVYDRISRLCDLSHKNGASVDSSKAVPSNSKALEEQIQKAFTENSTDVETFCKNWGSYESEQQNIVTHAGDLDKKIANDVDCILMCSRFQRPKLKPLCSLLAFMDEISKSLQSIGSKLKSSEQTQGSSENKKPEAEKVSVKNVNSNEQITEGKQSKKNQENESSKNTPAVVDETVKTGTSVVSSQDTPVAPKVADNKDKPKIVAPNPHSVSNATQAEKKTAQSTENMQSKSQASVKNDDNDAQGSIEEKINDKDGAEKNLNQEANLVDPNSDVISQNTREEDLPAGGEDIDVGNEIEPPLIPSSNEEVKQSPVLPSEKLGYGSRIPGLQNGDDSHVFGYFTVIAVICVAGYIAYHNKQKILAMVLEGRRSRGGRSRRRPSTANYRKLDCTLEEAVTSQCNSNVTHVIY